MINLDDPKLRTELQKIVFAQWQSLISSFSLSMNNFNVEKKSLDQYQLYCGERWGNLYKTYEDLTDDDKIGLDHFAQKIIDKLKEI